MKTFKSKIGLEIAIPIAAILGLNAFLMVFLEIWGATLILILVSLFVLHVFLTTYYQIDGDILIARCSILPIKRIDIRSVSIVIETNNPSSSFATSLDRLEIHYNSFERLIVSPKDKEGFVEELQKVNPNIKFLLARSMTHN